MALCAGRSDVVIVTGSSDGGIGAALSKAFHMAGCTVYATSRQLEAMAGLREAGIRTLALDVTNDESVKAAVEGVLAEAGRIDILVNNAGVSLIAPLVEADITKAQEVFDTNYWGTLRMVQAVAPHMAARRSGLICNVGSVVGYISTPWGAIYSSSKAAVHSLTDALRLELKPFNIRVVLLAPGAVTSNFGNNGLKRFAGNFTIYAPFANAIRERITKSQGKESMPRDVFARCVVPQLLSRRPPRHILKGGFVWLMCFVMWLPMWLRDLLLARTFKISAARLPPRVAPLASAVQDVSGANEAKVD